MIEEREDKSPPSVPPRRIGRQLTAAFAVIWVIAAALSIVHLSLLRRVKADLERMRADEMSIRDSLGLATAIREQYIHVAHCILHGSLDHLAHYQHWQERVESTVSVLEGAVPPSENERVASIKKSSREVDDVFRQQVIPALERGDLAATKKPRLRIELVAMSAAADADLVAHGVENLMVDAHKDAIDAARIAWISSVAGMMVLALVATALAASLRRVVLAPLASLTRAAQRLGGGDFESRVGDVGSGELALLASSFDTMTEELRQRQKQLVANERMAAIGQLAAGVAHEINNPIGVIRGYLSTMLKEANDDLAAELRILDEEALACQRIAEDLLTYARSGKLVVERAQMDEVVRRAAARFGESAEAKGRTFEIHVEPGEAFVDVVRVRQVVQNLLRNAIQASADETQVTVTGGALEGGYRIVVADRGPGVPSSLRGQVFEPFFTQRRAGSGLGLAVCKGIAEAHDGSIELRDREGGGTEVIVCLYDQSTEEDAHG